MGNLKVADSEYEDLKQEYAEISSIAEGQLKTYFESMKKICENSLTSGLVYNNFSTFVIEAAQIKGVLEDIAEVLCDKSESFVEDIDEKDKYLY